MRNTKLIALLKTFDRKELKDLEKFIVSPFHIKDRDLKPFLDVLKKYYPGFDNPKFTKESVYKALYPDKKFDEAYLRKLTSFLFKMAEDYLVLIELKERTIERDLMLLGQFRKRGLDSPYKGLANALDGEITSDKYDMEMFYSNRLHYSLEASNYYYAFKNDYKKAFSLAKEHISSAIALFLFFLFKGYNTRTIAKRSFAQDFDSSILDEMEAAFDVEGFMESDLAQDNEMINALLPDYYICKALFDIDDLESYNTAKRLFLENIHRYSRNTEHMYFRDFNSINLARINAPRSDAAKEETRREIFELARLQLEHDALIPDNQKYMPIENFKAILYSALNMKEFKWAEEFIEEYIPKLEPEQRKSMKYFALAILELRRGDFEKSLEYIINIKVDTPFLKFGVRQINFIVFFELEVFESARYLLMTTQKYYSSTGELSPRVKTRGENFLKYYKLLLKYADKQDREEIAVNYKKLKSESLISDKDWLVSKFEKIINS